MTRTFIGIASALLVVFTPVSAFAGIGRDLININPCLYADCEVLGASVANPYGWTKNPATLPVGTLPYVGHGLFISTGYFNLDVGDVQVDIESLTFTYANDPFVFQVNVVHADANGEASSAPGLKFDFNADVINLAAAIDLGRAGFINGLSVGIFAALPIADSDLDLSVGGVNVFDSVGDRDVNITLGAHYRVGERDWFAVGASVQMSENDVRATIVDPTTGAVFRTKGTTNAWFARVGVSLLPFVPFGAEGELAQDFRIGLDLEHRNIAVPDEGTYSHETGYVGLEARLLPDRWNALARYFRPYGLAGVDTDGGWGVGFGLYGNPAGPLAWFSLNLGYSSRDLAPSIGNRVEQLGIGISIAAPF